MNLTIRPAEIPDIPDVVVMGKGFYDLMGYSQVTEYDPDTVAGFLEHLINDDNGILLVVDDGIELRGMAAGMVFPFYLNHAHITGQELFYWIDPEFRKHRLGITLLDELENAAIEKGAKSFIMMSLDNLEPDRLAQFYARRGYVPFEHTFLRGLNGRERRRSGCG